jgi:serine protease Do
MNLSRELRKKFMASCLALLSITVPLNVSAEPVNSYDLSTVVEKITPAVVNISTTQKPKEKKQNMPSTPYDLFRDFLEKEFGMPEQMRKLTSLGSGFIISEDGYIVTNYHVVNGAEEIEVMLANDDNKNYRAKLIGYDQKTDLALLKIDLPGKLPYLEFGDSEGAKVGYPVIAVGNPFGLGGTVTSGIISAKARYITGETFDEYIQTDAAINSGNSGGPLCDGVTGKVLGVNSVILSPSGGNVGIGFAIPASIVKPVVMELKEKGKVTRGWLGVMVQPVDENIANAMGLDSPKGALVASIVDGSPASKAGLKIGDVILKFDGRPVDSTNKLPRIVGETPINKSVEMEVFRDGVTQKLFAVVTKPDKDDPFARDETSNEKLGKVVLGVKVSTITDEMRRTFQIDSSVKGVVVTDIEKSSILAFTGVRPGDVIVSVNQKSVNTPDEFERAFDEIKRKGKGSAALLISRRGVNQFIGIELK